MPRTAIVNLSYYSPDAKDTEKVNKTDKAIAERIISDIEQFSYSDIASGASDSISLTLFNIDKEWLGKFMPKRGARIRASIVAKQWEDNKDSELGCGLFVVDDISFSGRPLTCSIGGVSSPTNDDFKSYKRTKTWSDTTLKNIAREIAKAAGVELVYEASEIQIKEIEQDKETDSSFISGLCTRYGLALKTYNKRIVIFDMAIYEQQKAVKTFSETDMVSWSYNTTIEGTYTGVEMTYTDTDSGNTIKVSVGEKGRMYCINSQAFSEHDAELQAKAKLNDANRNIDTIDFTILGNVKLVASQCIKIKNLGKISGKYFVDEVKHSIGGGFKTSIKAHRIQNLIDGAASYETIKIGKKSTGSTTNIYYYYDEDEIGASEIFGILGTSGTASHLYTVGKGDTLFNITKYFYGDNAIKVSLYETNKDVIEAAAKRNGYRSSRKGLFLMSGIRLYLPGTRSRDEDGKVVFII